MAKEIVLERPKDGVDMVEVNAVKVAVGDKVTKGQPLLEVQADKAQLEVFAPVSGRIARLLVKEGNELKVGQPYCMIDSENGPAPAAVQPVAAAPASPAPARKDVELTPPTPPATRAEIPAVPAIQTPLPANGTRMTPAGPATRRLARELGVDLGQVHGTARFGRVTEEDVKGFVRQLASGSIPLASPAAGTAQLQAPPLPRFEDWGPVERQKLSMIRKATSRQMSLSWSLIPHVTQNDEADVTDLESFRKQQQAQLGGGVKLTVTAFTLKAATIVLKRFENFNSSLDTAAGQLILKRYYHLGVAVDTPAGLVVPVIRDVDRKSVVQLAGELTALADKARAGKLDGKDLEGGTFTITNLGGIGGTGFTPIVNHPQVAILGMSRSRLTPVVRDGAVTPRLMLPLSLSYDHRVIDGAAAARFTRQLAELLENPLLISLHA
jgi:pyruvate dehydrogenase E2 component (dihydrolipoamide acetyltransferase)